MSVGRPFRAATIVAGIAALSHCASGPEEEAHAATRIERIGELAAEIHHAYRGYYFSISPNEQWAVGVSRAVDAVLRVVHIPTRRTWEHPVIGKWLPNSFSEDSSRLYMDGLEAQLSPDMERLEFRSDAHPIDLESLEGVALGFEAGPYTRGGSRADSWEDADGVGLVTRDLIHGVLYEVAGEPGARSALRVSPPGSTKEIDFTEYMEAKRHRLREVFEEASASATPKEIPVLEGALEMGVSILMRSRDRMEISGIAVSPDGKWLAATTQWADGILIATADDPLAAHSYSLGVVHVLGIPIWSADSKRLYFYAMSSIPTEAGREETTSTVYILHLP